MSKAVADGLKYLVQHENYPREFLTTAKFIEFVCRWFELINSRKHVNALSKANMLEYDKAIQHLNETIELYDSIIYFWKFASFADSLIYYRLLYFKVTRVLQTDHTS